MHSNTPLVPAPAALAARLGVRQVLFKLDNLQPSGSFKIRGIAYQLRKAVASHPSLSTVVSSSGGNAGLAATTAAVHYGLAAHVFVPSSTHADTIALLRSLGAQVTVAGAVWDEAHQAALAYLGSLPAGSGILVHPFDHPDLWEGHSTLVDEVAHELDRAGTHDGSGAVPDLIICAVGGGGLLAGILHGAAANYQSKGRRQPIVLGVETDGAASYAAALAHGDGTEPVEIPAITSIAKSLGARKIAQAVLDKRDSYGRNLVRSLVVSDKQAVDALVLFADAFRFLVEPACAAALAPVLLDAGSGEQSLLRSVVPELGSDSTIVVEVCGGSAVSLDMVAQWRKTIQ
ncbi:tryptophan synthase beta subunit-like PLP-dependent enzyme [Entophlyctis helioformis]|nr:tryptophan synthase beta subunit-like PLP-dependent enzyme [Entophlyctis helioformis]